MRYIVVFIIIYFNSICVVSQELPSFDEEDDTTTARPNDEAPALPADPALDLPTIEDTLEQSAVKNTPTDSVNDNQNGNPGEFDVYEPSEEISEDLAVPFPSDI